MQVVIDMHNLYGFPSLVKALTQSKGPSTGLLIQPLGHFIIANPTTGAILLWSPE